jgi:hypothetical protein
MKTLGKILSITEIENIKLNNGKPVDVCDDWEWDTYNGYKITTEMHEFYILINNFQYCCESWGYFYLNDDEQKFVGTELREINLTDMALNKRKVEESGYYEDSGGIQFIDFVTNKGILQFAVYNAHNGYYGHDIIFAKDEEIFHQDTL